MGTLRVYRQALSDPWNRSILEGADRSWIKEGAQRPYLELVTDAQGRELSWTLFADDGESPAATRATEWAADGRPATVTEWFSEADSQVLHRFERKAEGDGVLETESLEYSGELDSRIERLIGADGTVLSERHFDADGDPLTELDARGLDPEGLPGPEDDSDPDAGAEAAEEEEATENVERDALGRPLKAERIVRRGDLHVRRTETFTYAEGCAAPVEQRVERETLYSPAAGGYRRYQVGFMQSSWDPEGRRTELLAVDMPAGDYEPDAYYRFEYSD